MSVQVVSGAMIRCSFGVAPSVLTVLPAGRVLAGNMPAANIMDSKPNVNIAPFGMCLSLANPQVAAATSAAMGVLTPQPCIPMTVAPWSPGSATVMVGGMPALNNTSICMCTWGGAITIVSPGQVQTLVP
jgi:hypothetical protein